MALIALIKKLRDIMYNDGGVDTDEQRLREIVWLLFLKIFDYREEEWEITKTNYEPVIPEGYRWRDWATGVSLKEQMTGEELLDFVNNKLFKVLSGDSIKNEKGEEVYLFTKTTRAALLVREFMKSSTNLMTNGQKLRQVINEINEIDFSSMDDRHSLNDIYEQLLKGLQKSNGGFYTGRALTSLIVDHVNPKIGDKVADFACGTGGFLVDAMKHMEKQEKTLSQEHQEILQNSFYGVEKKPLPYMLCTTNMLLNGIEEPDIMHGNSLEYDVRRYSDDEKFDVILMNPPYGGAEEFDVVQRNFPADLRASETADLFVVEIMYRLKENGRCGIILPDGFMFGDINNDRAKANIKKKLLEEFNLHTIIRLPGSCFAPYTQIATNLLFFDNTEEKTKDVWFYRYDLIDGKKFSMTKNPMTREKLSSIDNWWNNRLEIKDKKEDESMTETWKAKKVSLQEIVKNGYNIDYCGFPDKEKVILSPEETITNFKKEREKLDNLMDAKLQVILDLLGIGGIK
ncbi:class I SAM-dependent DNA methyltransferase [Clostridium perfringens]|nr:class I SAM-dependent DNA methyltransferase [Clostridium perfringens]